MHIDQNIEDVERMRDRQIPIRRLVEELSRLSMRSWGHEEDLHTVATEIVHTSIIWIVVKSEVNLDNVFSLHRNRR